MTEHAKFSPSGMYKRAQCAGSWEAEKGKISVSSEAAIEGTNAHTFAEWLLARDENPLDYIGQKLSILDNEGSLDITQELADAVKIYVDYIVEQSIGATKAACEIRLQMPGHIDFWGTADYVIAHDFGPLIVPDFKYGIGIDVYPDENMQIAAYILGALRWCRDNDITPMSIKGVVIQPRVHTWEGPRVWEISDIAAFEEEWTTIFDEVIVDCLSENPARKAGDHCGFCLGKLECPKLKDELLLVAIDEFKDAPVAEIKKEQVKEIVHNAALEELIRIHSHAGIVKKFLEETAAHLRAKAEGGEAVNGYKLVRSIGNRAWSLPEDEMVKKFRNKKLKQEDFYDRKLKGPAKIEQILEDEKFFEKFVTRPDKGLALVLEADKRAAYVPVDAATEFLEGDKC